MNAAGSSAAGRPSPLIAAAPISWGVCEVPGWGLQLEPGRVLREMAGLGFAATEFGPEGFLPDDAEEKAALLAGHGMSALGGFVPAILHRPDHDPLPAIRRELAGYAAAGASVLVLAASTGVEGYDAARPQLDDAGWATVFANLDAAVALAAGHGVRAVLHPHVGTMVETRADIGRVLAGSEIGFCLDTGHLLIGGTDPVVFAAEHAGRIAHTHLKDVDLARAHQVRSGELSYYEAVARGLYRPLGQGDADIRAIVGHLAGAGYAGWYVLEQDNVVTEEPPPGSGPIADARDSLAFLRSVLAELGRG